MIRSHQSFWNRMLLLGDFISTLLAMTLAWVIRFSFGVFPPSEHIVFPYSVILLILLATYIANTLNRLYVSRRRDSLVSEVVKLLRSHILLLFIVAGFLYALKTEEFPRSVLVLYILLSFAFMAVARLFGRLVLRKLRSLGFNQKHIVLVGASGAVDRLERSIFSYGWMGYSIDEVLTLSDDEANRKDELEGLPKFLDFKLQNSIVDEVILISPSNDIERISRLLSVCELHGVQTSIVPDYFGILPAKPRMHEFGDVPVIVVRGEPLDDPFNALSKRLFDIAFSVVAFACLTPVLVCAAIAVKVSSPGPIIYKQVRIGRNRRPFTIYKFRTMRIDDDVVGAGDEVEASEERAGWTVENDPRRTMVGTFLRRTSLDELPQFWNVLRGNMSVIGPRPEQPQFVSEFQRSVPKYMVKHHVRPGITGWAQVNGWRGDTSISERVRCDLYYIENWSFAMDLKIVLLTVFKGLVNRNAY